MTRDDLTPIPRDARPYQGHSAGVVSRTIAGTIDLVVVLIAVGAMYAGLNAFLFLLDPRGYEPRQFRLLLSITTTMVVLGLYLGTAWALTSRTYGDHVMGLRVVNHRGMRCGWPRAFLRAGAYVLFPIGLFWA